MGANPWEDRSLWSGYSGRSEVLTRVGSAPLPTRVWRCWCWCLRVEGVLWGRNQSVSPDTRWLGPSNQLPLQNSQQFLIVKWSFSKWLLLQAQKQNCKQPPKVTPPKRILNLQQMLPAENLFPTSQLRLKKGLGQCPLCPVVPVLDALDLQRGHSNLWAWIDTEYSNILRYTWQSSSRLYYIFSKDVSFGGPIHYDTVLDFF